VSIDALSTTRARIITALIGAVVGAFATDGYQEATREKLCPCNGVVMELPTACAPCLPITIPCPDPVENLPHPHTDTAHG
jgi:hypothetical protein